MDPSNEAAKAVQEVAKSSGKLVDAMAKAGGFISEIFKEPLSESVGILTDNLKFRRFENMLKLRAKVLQKMQEQGFTESRQIPLSIGVPLIEASSLVEDEALRERWANLLANYVNESSGVAMQRVFVSLLEEMSPLDATVLDLIYSLPNDHREDGGVLTKGLPVAVERDRYYLSKPDYAPIPPDDEASRLALGNLLRLGCIGPSTTWDGGEMLGVVYETTLGRSLHSACTLQLKSQ